MTPLPFRRPGPRPVRIALSVALAAALCLALPVTAAPASASADPAATAPRKVTVQTKGEKLNRLYEQYWEENLKLNPLRATSQGDPRYNDQLPNFLSAEFRKQSHEFSERWLKTIESVGSQGLSDQDLLSYEIFVREMKINLESDRHPSWLQPVNQFYNFAASIAQLGSGTGSQPFKTAADYDNWRKRAAKVPAVFDQLIANSREGVKRGVVQPKALMTKVLPQLDALIKDDPTATLFWKPVTDWPAGISEADKARLSADYRQMIQTELMPAYRRLREYIANDYLPHARDSAGLGALPGGEAWYAFNARRSTTTTMTPAEIHRIGLDEVARIHGEIGKIRGEVKFQGSLQDFFKFMQTDPRFTFKDEPALLAHYRGLEARIDKKIPQLFSLTPKAPFEIRPVEAFRAQSAAGGSYMRPSEDGTRPGIFYVNTYDLPTRKTWDAEDLYLHEAIPGHHFQLALQQELSGLPKFRRFGGETAFSEGWGLYAESLGKELGVYATPYDYFGYLQNELWRAIRLVVDTGLHSKAWTREQVIAYMLENSAESETQSTAEAERYMAIPGQALAYKIGELKIMELRKRAQSRLGARFDIREFHAEVLKDGSVPLDVLDRKIDRWIQSKQG
ncbi:DUF885 domain-containing protein [Lysobacter antibioticus]|uniref:DUF885 domain-containing protein n=1 Tax=Lysobacter antibioticus TaxID=84531 RepID=A0A0S2F984_LYSAN|nr:DUF885 family protein [Lysobacter antibioticus]ALN79997.1 hypothetical protein LA76x_1845 [Lysobacter antibioticus]